MNFNEKLPSHGRLEIIKIDKATGKEEVLFDGHNVITGGLGQSIAQFMSVPDCVKVFKCPDLGPQFMNFTQGPLGGIDSPVTIGSAGDDKDCCLGLLEITATVVFKNIKSPTSLGFDATIQVDTITKCWNQLCGITKLFKTGNLGVPIDVSINVCDKAVTNFNSDNKKPTITGWDPGGATVTLGKPVSIKIMRAKKLGCCTWPCPDLHGSKVHDYGGRVPGSGAGGVATAKSVIDVADQIMAKFSFGGGIAKPLFKPCCTKVKKVE